MRVGYACICLGCPDLRSQRTTVLRRATPERLRSLIRANLEGIQAILEYNHSRDLRLFRVGNEFVPFASHPVNDIPWWEDYAWHFRSVGRWIREHGHRLSFHASHYTVLNSQNPAVVRSSLADLTYYGRVLAAMQLGAEHKIVLHGGTAAPTAAEAEARFERALDQVPKGVRRHLVLENDDRMYSTEHIVALARRVGLPVVWDILHHACLPGAWGELPSSELLQRVFATWTPADGPPKIHFSSQDPDKRPGAHGYWVDGAELERFLQESLAVECDFDLMFEAKGKDLAVEAMLPLLRDDPRFNIPPPEPHPPPGAPSAAGVESTART